MAGPVSVLGDWPTYLLKSIPPDVRKGIEQEAGTGSMAEVIRSILCEHFDMDCEPVIARNKFLKINGTETMLLRLQPELWSAIQREARRRNIPHRSVIVEALADHYAAVT